jgi:hypothetical protein
MKTTSHTPKDRKPFNFYDKSNSINDATTMAATFKLD